MLPNESRTINYEVLTNQLFANRVLSTTTSYFTVTQFSPTPQSWDVNITAGGFQPSSLQIGQNDTVTFHSQIAQDVQVRDFGSGFQQVNVLAQQTASATYTTLANYTFYNSPLGYTGTLAVLPRSSVALAHDSTTDVQMQFRVSSVLAPSAVQINLLSSSITVNNNQTYPQALIEVRNTDPNLVVNNVHLSADRWVSSNFSSNDFNLQAGGVKHVTFNITPYVTKTSETNMTQYITLNVTTGNAGNTSKQIAVFINYQNLDLLNIGGANYTVTVLGINDTISACLQHMNDPGFEGCRSLADYFKTNVTIIKEIPAQYKYSEQDIANTKTAVAAVGDVSQRMENLVNLYVDKQHEVEGKVDANAAQIQNLTAFVQAAEKENADKLRAQNMRFWVVVILVGVVGLFQLVLWVIENVDYLEKLEGAKQI
jgi:plastocyanin